MKKFISILLSVLMIATCFVGLSSVFAAGEYTCHCDKHNGTADCTCCVYCPTSKRKLADLGDADCCMYFDPSNGGRAVFCCAECSGFFGCRCGETNSLCKCAYCVTPEDSTQNTEEYRSPQIFDTETQKSIISIFRSVLTKLSNIFNKFFDRIADFLRIDEVLK